MLQKFGLAIAVIGFLLLSGCQAQGEIFFLKGYGQVKEEFWAMIVLPTIQTEKFKNKQPVRGTDFKFVPQALAERAVMAEFSNVKEEYNQIKEALDRGINYLISQQTAEGYWMGVFEADTSYTADYILLMHYLGMVDEMRQQKAINHILGEQQIDGGWSAYPEGPSVLYISVINYLALKLSGMSRDHQKIIRAKEFILKQGGAELVDKLVKTKLALFGQVPWSEIYPINTNLLFFEDFIYRIGYMRSILIPFTIIYENYYRVQVPAAQGIGEIFKKDPWTGVKERPLRKGRRQKEAIDWILKRQEADGNWAGVFMYTMFSLMALKSTQDPSFQSIIEKGMKGVCLFQNESNSLLNQQGYQSPIMDTGYIVQVLLSSGLSSEDQIIQKAVQYLLSRQSPIYGDWHHNNQAGKPGGWGFGHHNLWSPDNDDTAIVLNGLALLDEKNRMIISDSLERGLDWLLSMQNIDGGWAAFDKNTFHPFNTWPRTTKSHHIPWDSSNADITARVILALTSLGYPRGKHNRTVIQKALRYLRSQQKPQGYWYGRWAVNCVYATGEILKALMAAGEDPGQAYIRRAVDWLKRVQNDDGGWGETPASYTDPDYIGVGESTDFQTAYVLIGLIYAGEASSPEVGKGIEYLVNTMLPDGSWRDKEFLGTNLPGYAYGRYELVSTCKSVYALWLYLRFLKNYCPRLEVIIQSPLSTNEVKGKKLKVKS